MPMTSAYVGGGVTFDGTESLAPRLTKFTALIGEVGRFVLQEYIPIVLALKYLYPKSDNVTNGGTSVDPLVPLKGVGGGLGRFLAWGAFPQADGTLAIAGGVKGTAADFTVSSKGEIYTKFLGTGVNSVAKNLTEDIEWSRYDKASQDTAAYGKDGTGAAIASTTAAYPGTISRTKPLRSNGLHAWPLTESTPSTEPPCCRTSPVS